MATSVFQDINATPEERLKAGQVNIPKIMKEAPDKVSLNEKVIKKFNRLPKRKKRTLLKRLLKKRLRIRKIRMPQNKTRVSFQPVKRPEVIKTRQPNEPSHYFKQSDKQEAKFIGKYRVK